MAADQDAFLSRWARRKNAASTGAPEPELAVLEAQAEHQAIELRAEQDAAAIAKAERQAENRAAAEAVDLETADETTDFKLFMKEGVPTALRQMALRKLWTVHPIFGALDGLNDYDQDFNVIHTILTKFESAWKVGKGYAKSAEEKAEEMIKLGETRAEEAGPAGDGETGQAKTDEPANIDDDVQADASTVEPDRDGSDTEDQADDENPDISSEMASAGPDDQAPFVLEEPVALEEEEAPRRVPLRRRFALDEWSEG